MIRTFRARARQFLVGTSVASVLTGCDQAGNDQHEDSLPSEAYGLFEDRNDAPLFLYRLRIERQRIALITVVNLKGREADPLTCESETLTEIRPSMEVVLDCGKEAGPYRVEYLGDKGIWVLTEMQADGSPRTPQTFYRASGSVSDGSRMPEDDATVSEAGGNTSASTLRAGITYQALRPALFADGWRQGPDQATVERDCSFEEWRCSYPEVDECAGTGEGPCVIVLIDGAGSRSLRIITTGGPPPDAIVDSWEYGTVASSQLDDRARNDSRQVRHDPDIGSCSPESAARRSAAVAQKNHVSPSYPDTLRRAGVEGVVVAAFDVDTTGMPDLSTLTIVETPHELFSRAVERVLAKALYHPATCGGRTVRARVEQSFEFALNR